MEQGQLVWSAVFGLGPLLGAPFGLSWGSCLNSVIQLTGHSSFLVGPGLSEPPVYWRPWDPERLSA
jgi:hypothetical protein